MASPLRQDPTRTTTIRRNFIAAMERRFRILRKSIELKIVYNDALGLTLNQKTYEWAFGSDPEKLEAFKEWLQEQFEAGLLFTDEPVDVPWLAVYVHSAYRQGLLRAYHDTRRHQLGQTAAEYRRGRETEFIEQTFAAPETTAKIRLLYTRAFDQLEGITQDMSGRMSRVLAKALVDGISPRRAARNLVREIEGMPHKRALDIARTEIIYAHSEGQLDAFEALGVDELGLLAEVLTAGDGLVCPVCTAQAGRRYTVATARGLIPFHPNCRCCWVPWVPLPQRRGKNVVLAAE